MDIKEEDKKQSRDQAFNINNIKLIVGLGNLDELYNNTRHNIGFNFIDYLANQSFKLEEQFKSLITNYSNDSIKLKLAKPTTFMNKSGEAVRSIIDYYNFDLNEILIVHDDLDIELGKYKIQFDRGPKIHNGIISIENKLGSSKFWRLRLGIDNRSESQKKHMSGADYVLGKFKKEEIEINESLINVIISSWKL